MAISASKIIERIRANGANVMLDRGKIVVVNRAKLPPEALEFIRSHAREIANFLDEEADFQERAAIIEYDGGLTRAVSEYLTKLLQSHPPQDTNPADWSWFVGQAAKVIDDAPLRSAA